MTNEDRDRIVAKLQDCVDFFSSIEEDNLEVFPVPYLPTYTFEENVTEWSNIDGEYTIDKEKSLIKLAKISKALGGKRDKIMDTDGLRLVVKFPSDMEVSWKVSKEVTCTKKVVGKKLIPGRPATEDRYEDEVEWVCEEVVLLTKGGNI